MQDDTSLQYCWLSLKRTLSKSLLVFRFNASWSYNLREFEVITAILNNLFKWNFQSNGIFHAFGDFLPHLDHLDPSKLIASHNGLCHRSLHFLYFYCRWRTCWTYGMNFTAFVISIIIKLPSYQSYFEFEYVYCGGGVPKWPILPSLS